VSVRYAFRPAARRAVPPLVLIATLLAVGAAAGAGPPRTVGGRSPRPPAAIQSPLATMTVTRTLNARALAECLMGPTLTVNEATLSAAAAAVGAFAGGMDVLGLPAGVVLSTGDVDSLAKPNLWEDFSTPNLTPGDASLDALLDPQSGGVTYDAAVLVIDFTAPSAGTLNLSFVFGSEEYNEFVDYEFNDIFAIFLDGTSPADNIALTAGACATTLGLPIAINSVNCGVDGTDTGAANCGCYRDNADASIEIEMDGLTQVFTASAPLSAGPHQLKIAIADVADEIYDAAAFIKCQSGEVPARTTTWGRLKTMYR